MSAAAGQGHLRVEKVSSGGRGLPRGGSRGRGVENGAVPRPQGLESRLGALRDRTGAGGLPGPGGLAPSGTGRTGPPGWGSRRRVTGSLAPGRRSRCAGYPGCGAGKGALQRASGIADGSSRRGARFVVGCVGGVLAPLGPGPAQVRPTRPQCRRARSPGPRLGLRSPAVAVTWDLHCPPTCCKRSSCAGSVPNSAGRFDANAEEPSFPGALPRVASDSIQTWFPGSSLSSVESLLAHSRQASGRPPSRSPSAALHGAHLLRRGFPPWTAWAGQSGRLRVPTHPQRRCSGLTASGRKHARNGNGPVAYAPLRPNAQRANVSRSLTEMLPELQPALPFPICYRLNKKSHHCK